MTIREVPAYEVVCDGPECTFRSADTSSDYAFWMDDASAELEWTESDYQLTKYGEHFCDACRVNECGDCDETRGLINDADDDSGDWWCKAHFEASPEYEAPGVVI